MSVFKNLLPKQIASQQAQVQVSKKSEQFKKMTATSTQITVSILKVHEAYMLQLPRIMNILFNQAIKEQECEFYKDLRVLYLDIYKQYQIFTLEHIQTPTSQLTNFNNAKQNTNSSLISNYQKLLRSYSQAEASLHEQYKKYQKYQKSLNLAIQGYKQSFTQAKLIYNIDQKIKRYNTCDQYYRQTVQEYQNVMEIKDKLQDKKKEVLEGLEAINLQEVGMEAEVQAKLFGFFNKFNFGLCQNLRKRIRICKEGRMKVEKDKVPAFFAGFKLQEDDQTHDMEEGRGRRRANMSQLKQQSSLQSLLQLKKMGPRVQKYIQLHKNQHLKLYQFHLQFFKSAQKKSLTQLKQVLQNIERIQKKIKQLFCKQTYQQIKVASIIIKVTMDVYTEVQKKIGTKIITVGQNIEEMKALLKGMVQELFAYLERISIDAKGKNKSDKQPMEAGEFKEKVGYILEIIKATEVKLSPLLCNIKILYSEILNIYDLGLKDSYEKVEQIGKHSVKNYEQNIANIKSSRNKSIFEQVNQQWKDKIICQDDGQKTHDFKKLRKPAQAQVLDSKQTQQSPQGKNEQSLATEGNEGSTQSPSKKTKKHLQFIQSKITFFDNEQFKGTYSCALADKIILQGRLYITSFRICFYSSFNPSNVFFGETFITIPNKDIIALQKRKNGIVFDNSISITTVKGQIFLTSFLKRNEAYSMISQITGIKRQQQAYQKQQHQSDQSQAHEKVQLKGALREQVEENKEIQMEDDLKQVEIADRAAEVDKMMDLISYSFKDSASVEFKFAKLTAYKVLRMLVLDGEITIANKKYSNVQQYFKKVIMLHRDVEITPFEPSLYEHLNPTSIKSSSPIKYSRRMCSTVPTPSSNIPFLPKFTKANEKQTLYIVSKHKWAVDNEVQSSGAPYTDSFRVYYRTVCTSDEEKCRIDTKMYIHFLKNVIVKGTIQSRTTEESALQFKKQYEELRKYLVSLNKPKKVKKQALSATPGAQKQQQKQEQGQGQGQAQTERQLKQAQKCRKYEQQIVKLKKQIGVYRIVILVMLLIIVLGTVFRGSSSSVGQAAL